MAKVKPTRVFFHNDQTKIVVIRMRQGCYSTGILTADQREAWFAFDFDEEPLEDASLTAQRLAEGFYGDLSTFRQSNQGYTMPYPIQDR